MPSKILDENQRKAIVWDADSGAILQLDYGATMAILLMIWRMALQYIYL